MAQHLSAAPSGVFAVGGDFPVHRLGFGAMRITGPGIWGGPSDPQAAVRLLRRAADLGVSLFDTADSYGPFVSEDLVAEALYPYDGLLIATKGGLVRHGPDLWRPVGRPEYLRQCVLMSLRRLKVERIDLWQLHRIDPLVPAAEQFEVIAEMIKEGLIRHAGLSEVAAEEIKAARRVFPVATVQNRFNLVLRTHEGVLDYCRAENIGFIPFFPLAAGRLASEGGVLARLAAAHGVEPSQIALAWLLAKSPVMLPIPGTGRVAHLEENVRACAVALSEADLRDLDAAAEGS